MSTVGAYEAKTHLPCLLDRVSNGETITITKHGREIARLVPAGSVSADPARIVEALRAAREGVRLDWPEREGSVR
jgi:prevent-host-death family protein